MQIPIAMFLIIRFSNIDDFLQAITLKTVDIKDWQKPDLLISFIKDDTQNPIFMGYDITNLPILH